MSQLERIKKVVLWLIGNGYGKSQADIGKLLGYSNKSYISQLFNGKTALPKDFIERLASIDSKINLVWIQSGEGEMIVDTGNKNVVVNMFSGYTDDQIKKFIKAQLKEEIMDLIISGEVVPLSFHQKTVKEKEDEIAKVRKDLWLLEQELSNSVDKPKK